MKSKDLLILILCVTVLLLCGCSKEDKVATETENFNIEFGVENLIEIGNGLYYDSMTKIVYWWNGALYPSTYSSTTPSPYYAPNGLPYRYNVETNVFEEINKINKEENYEDLYRTII